MKTAENHRRVSFYAPNYNVCQKVKRQLLKASTSLSDDQYLFEKHVSLLQIEIWHLYDISSSFYIVPFTISHTGEGKNKYTPTATSQLITTNAK